MILWIAGQKAQGKKLKDTDTDTRFRVDLGKFLELVIKGRNLFLWGEEFIIITASMLSLFLYLSHAKAIILA